MGIDQAMSPLATGPKPHRVHLMASLRPYAEGLAVIEVGAPTVHSLLRELSHRYPALAPHLETGIAIALDGVILQDQLFANLPEGAEIHILPMIAGG